MLLLGAVPATAFNYTDGWEMVSAPPPPGPYRVVNLDPRIPGQDVVPLMPVEEPPVAANAGSVDAMPAGVLENPPAAGTPAMQTAPDGPAASVGRAAPQFPGPARGPARMMQAPPTFGYPAPPRGYSGYPGSRNMPPMGYYGAPARRPPQQVPPPPVYDAMMKNRPPYGHQNSQGTP